MEILGELLVVRSKVKEMTKLNVASDFADALSREVEKLLKKAEERAKANKRSTLQPRDL